MRFRFSNNEKHYSSQNYPVMERVALQSSKFFLRAKDMAEEKDFWAWRQKEQMEIWDHHLVTSGHEQIKIT